MSGRWYTAVVLALGLTGLLSAQPGWAEARMALVIGNGAYQDAPLLNPPNDAQDMAAKLRELGFTVLARRDLSRREMRAAVREFEDALRQQRGVGLFYYAGHGVQVEGRNFLLPIGADIRREHEVPDEALEAEAVLRAMEEAGAETSIVILDACRNNPYVRGFRDATRGLARMDSPAGAFIAYATGPGSVSRDGSGRNSPYARHLLDTMGTPDLTIEQVFKRVLVAVEEETKGAQVPWVSSSLRGDFYFARGGGGSERVYRVGQVFRDRLKDGTEGPAMVVIEAKAFDMGSLGSEAGRDDDERRHRISIPRDYALGRYEVTVGEFRRFVEAAGYRTEAEQGESWLLVIANWLLKAAGYRTEAEQGESWLLVIANWLLKAAGHRTEAEQRKFCLAVTGRKWKYEGGTTWWAPGFQQGEPHPVVCVSWNDAMAYVGWLSRETGKGYRLPTEAEWEYGARGGKETARYWGESADQGCPYANAADLTAQEKFPDRTFMNCRDGYVYTAPVGSFEPNQYGLYDVLGNVWEWTCSEYNGDYGGREQVCIGKNDATAPRVSRGGSWTFEPDTVRSAVRFKNSPSLQMTNLGFRLARDL